MEIDLRTAEAQSRQMRTDTHNSRRCGEQAAGLVWITATAWLRLRIGSTMKVLLPLLLLTLPDGLQAQFNYTINNGTITITRYTGSAGAVTIPDTINGLPVTSIGNYAFQNEITLISVTIGNGVTSLGSGAFSGCTGLAAVAIGNSVISLGYQVFSGCTSLRSVTIPSSLVTIGDYAFYNCPGLTTVTIPDSVTAIGSFAFNGCAALTSLMIGNSVTSIGNGAFNNCYHLPSVTVPQQRHQHRNLCVLCMHRPDGNHRGCGQFRLSQCGWSLVRYERDYAYPIPGRKIRKLRSSQQRHQHRVACVQTLPHPDGNHRGCG